ncbi:PREDICTED: aminoacylase-1-like [Papilio polytes]|uniref:aminoacylase-1-like n=1 Tax=Papilio polytes TaxID=76194 RepID=UPI000676A3AF|nr:PREDICTED: aminoacylase-1-like [Papilio polytes]
MSEWEKDEVIQRFREYLRIPTVHPNVDYNDCVNFLKRQADLLNLPYEVHELLEKKPVVLITWQGTQPELPSILLNSHMDVVPVYEEHWKYPPFEAHITADGWIYARGAQDMKSNGILHLEAVRNLKKAGVRLMRTVHISFVPDEEIGGMNGMKIFCESEEFRKLNVGFEMDESYPSDDSKVFHAFHGERTARQVKITCRGVTGHGAMLQKNEVTAGEKINYIINKLMEFREKERQKFVNGALLGDVTTINLTKLEGGVQINVLPEQLSAYFDIRISPFEDHDAFENMILNWCKEAGENVTLEYFEKNPEEKTTKLDKDAYFWNALLKAVRDMGLDINSVICPGTTDARFIRRQGIPAIGFSPILNTPQLIHAHNERVHVDDFKHGIIVMEKVIVALANV